MDPYRLADGRPRVRREEQLLFESALVAVGVFDARPEDPHFRCSGPPGEHLFVFPSSSVRIEHVGGRAFVADRSLATLYEPDRHYTRSPVSARGDRAHWFALRPEALDESVARRGRGGRAGRVFDRPWVPVDAATFARQCRLVERLAARDVVEPLEVEETALELARRIFSAGAERTSDGVTAAQARLAERARAALARRYREPEPLTALADRLAVSPFHLARVFRAVTGTTLHRQREQLRLRRARLDLRDRLGDLTGLALDLGYSSHSHFTAAFRRAFGVPPSAALGDASDREGSVRRPPGR